ncbi:hypothetical protein TNCT_598561 [Trichonephila clavata]|uniref:Uncharacterized protein n=1 Tax=Trichonephila clavata TaxID=2740835 RepID=A0A8X6ILC2_TRICU|nr:hypothetical protein TNCT_598561 [Trichonephila clavata]
MSHVSRRGGLEESPVGGVASRREALHIRCPEMRVLGRWGSWWCRVDRDACVVHFGKFPKSGNYWESGVCRTSSRGGQPGVGELGKWRAFQVQVARIELYGVSVL